MERVEGKNGMKRNTPEHPKLAALSAELRIRRYAAAGILELLWHATARFCPQGDVGRYSNPAIAGMVDWTGDPDRLVNALVKCGWLDDMGTDNPLRLIVHHWSDHADDSVNKYLAAHKMHYADGKEVRRGKQKEEQQQTSREKSREVARTRNKSRKKSPAPCLLPLAKASPPNPPEGGGAGEGRLNPDDAHNVLTERPELSGLTYEQDIMARQDFATLLPIKDPGWLEIAEWAARRAVLAGDIEQPGSWLRVQYGRWFDEQAEKKERAAGGGDPRERRFVGHGEAR